jgi:formylglycine-generating enzyme required for sulfatase activity
MRTLAVFLLLFTLGIPSHSQAALAIPVVLVGNRNADDATGFGGVSYLYSIGKHEVTNAQYTEFLNSVDSSGANPLGLYSDFMASDARGGINFTSGAANGSKYSVKSGRGNNPVVFVTWYSAARFANWLHNAQGTGNTEDGAYTLLGGSATPSNADSIVRNAGAQWFLPSEDEWYKAAYHKNDGATGNYWAYPTATNSVPFSDQPPGSDAPVQSNTANFLNIDGAANGYDDGFAVTGSPSFDLSQNYLTDVGAYSQAVSPYGTMDQGGNVWEWNESLFATTQYRGMRGSSWFSGASQLAAATRESERPFIGFSHIGFRVATIVPEPSAVILCGLLIALAGWARFAPNRRGLAHFAESSQQNVPVPLSETVLGQALS